MTIPPMRTSPFMASSRIWLKSFDPNKDLKQPHPRDISTLEATWILEMPKREFPQNNCGIMVLRHRCDRPAAVRVANSQTGYGELQSGILQNMSLPSNPNLQAIMANGVVKRFGFRVVEGSIIGVRSATKTSLIALSLNLGRPRRALYINGCIMSRPAPALNALGRAGCFDSVHIFCRGPPLERDSKVLPFFMSTPFTFD